MLDINALYCPSNKIQSGHSTLTFTLGFDKRIFMSSVKLTGLKK